MTSEEKSIYTARADVIKALAHPTRLWVVDQLIDGEKCVCELMEGIDADVSTVSKHLSLLKSAAIIEGDKRGKWVYYRLSSRESIEAISKSINDLLSLRFRHAANGQK